MVAITRLQNVKENFVNAMQGGCSSYEDIRGWIIHLSGTSIVWTGDPARWDQQERAISVTSDSLA